MKKNIDLSKLTGKANELGVLSRFIRNSLVCYTDKRMFKWFGYDLTNESISNSLNRMYSAEANLIFFSQNSLVNLLIMKAWTLCALDVNCISPKGSNIYGDIKKYLIKGCETTCECHRFDQDALTIVLSMFYGHPVERDDYLPAYALSTNEMDLFNLERRSVYSYIIDQIKCIFN
jgi:hypothetical protein